MISDAIREKLLDPDSARFKWLELSELQSRKHCRPEAIDCALSYCGLVNSKNTFGGYAGDVPYFIDLIWMKRPLFSAPVLFLFLKSYLYVIAKNSLLAAAVIGIGDANWHSPESRTLLMMCAKSGYKKLYLAK